MPEMLSTDATLDHLPTDQDLARLQFTTLLYYLHCTNPDNGLVRDKTEPNTPASIAAIGMALATIPVMVERGIIVREFAAKIARNRLRYLMACPQGPDPNSSGYKVSSIIFWISKRGAGFGNPSCLLSIRRFYLLAP
jgi:hypothetical protein